MAKFKVIREHIGDKPYASGDTREAALADVAHLIPHVLQPLGRTTAAKPAPKKAAAPHPNKAEKPSSNKEAQQ